ncbi:MAG: ASCH domain-containing protein [Lachnospiraceae bacterium]
MKCLSIKQPWAGLIVRGWKDVENRTWTTSYRGEVLIHAGKKFDMVFKRDIAEIDIHAAADMSNCTYFRMGAIIGKATLIDCVQNHPSRWAEDGLWHWVFADPVIFDQPIPYKGQLGLFEVSKS